MPRQGGITIRSLIFTELKDGSEEAIAKKEKPEVDCESRCHADIFDRIRQPVEYDCDRDHLGRRAFVLVRSQAIVVTRQLKSSTMLLMTIFATVLVLAALALAAEAGIG